MKNPLTLRNVLWYYISEVIKMKQHRKRQDLVRLNVMIPEEINDWITDICNKTDSSRGLVVTRLLTTLKNMQKNLALD